MSADIDGLISQLRNFRSRAVAMESLIGLGEAAVPALIGALKSRHEGIRSAAMMCLGQIGDTRACPALLGLIEDDAARADAVHALQRISGERFDPDAKTWAGWMQSQGIPVPSEYDTGESGAGLARLISEAIKGLDVAVKSGKHGPTLTVKLPTGRRQVVKVRGGFTDSSGHRLVAVYTDCGEADPDRYEWALRNNLRITQGRLAIQDIKGKPTFVLVNTHLRETLQIEEIRISIMKIASVGDKIEKMLTGEDMR
ncbi:MAG: HEAT repeat domain-containing protein [Planctomycetes bacterium]|nr:HEAT repeat domain-containing protein [Planctomycetota bacterium]